MCLFLLAKNTHRDFKIIIAANRDEFYERPAKEADFWEEDQNILAGKDLKAGGTWLGITRTGRIAAITNFRDLKNIKENAPSRGELTLNFLKSNNSPEEYYNKIKDKASEYNGFNLIFGIKDDLYFFSNQSYEFLKLESGIYGLSNCLLDTLWPKVEKTKKELNEMLSSTSFNYEKIFNILSDKSVAPDEQLPDTGVGLEFERVLSSVFIESPEYGTRSSTVILIDRNYRVNFIEKVFLPGNKENIKKEYTFNLI